MSKQITIEQAAYLKHYLERVSEITGVPAVDIMGRRRDREISTARHLLMWCLVRLCKLSTTEVGLLTGRNHASVIHNVATLENIVDVPTGKREKALLEQLNGDAYEEAV